MDWIAFHCIIVYHVLDCWSHKKGQFTILYETIVYFQTFNRLN